MVESFSKSVGSVNDPRNSSSVFPGLLALQMVEAVADYAIFALNVNGIILTWNRGAERIKGYTREEIVGRSFEVFYPDEAVRRNFPRYELEVAARDGRFEDNGWRIRKDGSRFWARAVITALYDEAGRLTGYAKVTSDLTDRKRAGEYFAGPRISPQPRHVLAPCSVGESLRNTRMPAGLPLPNGGTLLALTTETPDVCCRARAP
jgi:PAS domain S-box-containing protein